MFKKNHGVIVLGLAALLAWGSMPAVAAEHEHTAGFSFSPMVGRYFPAKNRLLDDSDFVALGLAYDYASPWGVEFSALLAEADVTDSDLEADLTGVRLDLLYHFRRQAFQPYALFGAGNWEAEFADNGREDDAVAHLGLGAKYFFSPALALRADTRLMRGIDSGENDYLASLGLVFKFGGKSVAKATPTPAPAVVAPADSDGDGVVDSADKCPGTAKGLAVDADGCMRDGDRDGVPDANDQCPDTEAGARVKADGCYVVLTEDVSVQLSINFGNNSDAVPVDAYAEIEKVANFLKEYPLTNVVIEGHTDSSGSADYNRDLSQRRASSVARILVEQFVVNSNRVSAKGYGEDRPLVDNDSAENRAKNRRVTAVVSAQVDRVVK